MDVNDVENSRKKEGFELKKRWKKPLFCVVEQTFGQQEGAWMEISVEVNGFVIIVLRVMGVKCTFVTLYVMVIGIIGRIKPLPLCIKY